MASFKDDEEIAGSRRVSECITERMMVWKCYTWRDIIVIFVMHHWLEPGGLEIVALHRSRSRSRDESH